MTYSLLVSHRSEKTNRWLVYRVHSVWSTFKDAIKACDLILDSFPSNTVRVKVELLNF